MRSSCNWTLRRALDHAIHIALLHGAHVPQFDDAARHWRRARCSRPCPTTAASTDTPAAASASRSAARIESATAVWSAIRPFCHPATAPSRCQEAHARAFQSADHHPRPAAARIESNSV